MSEGEPVTARKGERHSMHEVAFWSHDAEKRGPGRPQIAPQSFLELAQGVRPQIKSRRGLQNAVYALHTMATVVDEPDCQWLIEDVSGRDTIRAELGRLADKEDLIAIAKMVCAGKPKARDAVRLIREYRLTQSGRRRTVAEPHSIRLAAVLGKVIEDYRTRYPDTTDLDVWDSIEQTCDALRAGEQSDAGDAAGE